MTEWQNWSGLVTARPEREATPADVGSVVAAVERARAEGTTVKMVGTGHSFTAIAAPEHTMLRPQALTGIVGVDRDAMTVTALAGTRLKHLNAGLEALGLSLHNMGDVAEQTLAGAISTGTHGTGGVAAGLAAQVVGLELVTGTGEVLRATERENPDVLAVARVGLGALGILTTVTFRVEPLFLLEATEQPMRWDEALAGFDQMTAESHHVDMYWFPHSDRMLTKRNDRLDADLSEAQPLPRLRAWFDDDLLANKAFGALTAAANLVPRVIPPMNRVNARLLGARTYSDVAHRVFIAERDVVFREMEYAVPREAGLSALREARAALDASDLTVSFPVEIRVAPADDIPLSTASGRNSFYLAFHTHRRADHTAYFALMEQVMRAHGGRPHWGKVHTRQADGLAPLYPRFEEFLAMRDRLDPDRVFANGYLRRVLGP
ncbi:FAD-binding protein [Nocardioides sp. cx-169]|uniref:D-arabinono-1,4-lactone oxidase n=1 Tax=Nocardioides sp. cx-169 TaxID=2899080 RepID=UPI001E4A37EB|nr:D-arabinono-1,4-lactone oxidase [Nocardioides sp. cx-169]MCD4534880.1 FAD-binding protein [Nocardioides sp. cx-169]